MTTSNKYYGQVLSNVTEDILQIFCCRDVFYKHYDLFKEPFYEIADDGCRFNFACNGYCALRVEGFIPWVKANSSGKFFIAQFDGKCSALAVAKTPDVWNYYQIRNLPKPTFERGVDGGEGLWNDECVLLGGRFYALMMLHKLVHCLDGLRVAPAVSNDRECLYFRFDGGDGVLMPLSDSIGTVYEAELEACSKTLPVEALIPGGNRMGKTGYLITKHHKPILRWRNSKS